MIIYFYNAISIILLPDESLLEFSVLSILLFDIFDYAL